MKDTIQRAENANAQAKLAYEESLNIYTDINSLTVPDVDPEGLKAEAKLRREEASHNIETHY